MQAELCTSSPMDSIPFQIQNQKSQTNKQRSILVGVTTEVCHWHCLFHHLRRIASAVACQVVVAYAHGVSGRLRDCHQCGIRCWRTPAAIGGGAKATVPSVLRVFPHRSWFLGDMLGCAGHDNEIVSSLFLSPSEFRRNA